jgi:alpha-2-macroglobulin
LPENGPLGQYNIQAKDYLGYAFFDVQDYTKAAFQVETKLDKEEYLEGEDVNLDINANYYFGVPLDGGDVEYSILTQNYYFDKYQDEYFNFGSDFYDCYENCYYGDRFILKDKTKIDKNGSSKINFKIDYDKWFKNDSEKTSKIVILNTTVTNNNGQSVSRETSFIVHAGTFYLGITAENYFINKEEDLNVKIKSVDTYGTPIALDSISLEVNRISWISNKRQEVDGSYYYTSERKEEKVLEKKISTDLNGDFNDSIKIAEEGQYIIYIQKEDNNRLIKSSFNFYVYGNKLVAMRQNNDKTLELINQNENLEANDKAEFVIMSPYEKAKALISIERGKIFSYEIIDISQSLFKYSFPLEDEYAPNIFATVTLLSDKPEIKFGETKFSINSTYKKLELEVKVIKRAICLVKK